MQRDAKSERHRDVAAFDERAPDYDAGWRGQLHHRISDRVCEIALAVAPNARRVLDVGCGTGYLLEALCRALPDATELVGVDAAPGMIVVATARRNDPRLVLSVATAERLPLTDPFDLVVSSTSFDHWADQRAGLSGCARALGPGGRLILCDLFSPLLTPTLVGARRAKARTRPRAEALVREAGLVEARWHGVYTPLINAIVATKP